MWLAACQLDLGVAEVSAAEVSAAEVAAGDERDGKPGGGASDVALTAALSPPPPVVMPERGEMELLPPAGQGPQVEPLLPDAYSSHGSSRPSDGRMPLEPYWDHGLKLISPDENFTIHPGGNLQWDSVWLIGPEGVLASGSNAASTGNSAASLIRRARLRLDGSIYQRFDYTMEYDLANAVNDNSGLQNPTQDDLIGSPVPCNVWVQIREVPWFGQVRIGNQKTPLGMTNNTFQGFLPFMERADNQDGFYGPFNQGYSPGISATNWTESERMTWRYGVYRPLKNAFGIGLEEYMVAGRMTALPVDSDDGQRLVHFGLAATQGSLVNDEVRLRVRPLLRNGPGYAVPVLINTGVFPASSQYFVGPELAAVLGSWTLQAEWTGNFIQDVQLAGNSSQTTAFFQGGYVQMLYFLTGEHQRYERRSGAFGRVIPLNPLGSGSDGGCGCGAWQLGARYSYLNLNDDAITGGRVEDLTIGLNWYLNPNMKFQGNYILEHREVAEANQSGWFSGLGIRAACDF
ncbi:MAG: porin [Pirellulales bacterium]